MTALSRATLNEIYRSHCDKNINLIDHHTKKGLRIATYNIHYWSDLYESANFDNIISDIIKINADILCLQEVSFDYTRFNKKTHIQVMEKFKEIGYVDSLSVYGSNYIGSRYGNMILTREPMIKKSQGLLIKGNGKVKRGYCLASIKSGKSNVEVCCVHLDVFDETGITRHKQLSELLTIIGAPKNNLIICGDFNSMRTQDYSVQELNKIIQNDTARKATTDTETLKQMTTYGYHSCFDHLKSPSPSCTVWSGRAIDFIFVPMDFIYNITKSEVFYTINSDHYAIYTDYI